MGCDWINYKGSLIGYGIEYSTIFSNTKYKIDEFKSYYPIGDDIDPEKEESDVLTCDSERCYFGLIDLEHEWGKYLNQFHPHVDKKKIPGFDIICESFSGSYETVGYKPIIVWGYNIEDSVSKPTKTDQIYENIGMNYTFPNPSMKIFTDFMTIFRDKICKASSSSELKNLINSSTSFRVFGRL